MRARLVVIEGTADQVTVDAIRAVLEAAAGPVSLHARVDVARPTLKALVARACYETGVSVAAATGYRQTRGVVRTRTAVSWVATHRLGATTVAIAKALNRDHSSIVQQIARAEELLDRDPAFRLLIGRLEDYVDGDA